MITLVMLNGDKIWIHDKTHRPLSGLYDYVIWQQWHCIECALGLWTENICLWTIHLGWSKFVPRNMSSIKYNNVNRCWMPHISKMIRGGLLKKKTLVMFQSMLINQNLKAWLLIVWWINYRAILSMLSHVRKSLWTSMPFNSLRPR